MCERRLFLEPCIIVKNSADASSMFLCLWMFSLTGSEGDLNAPLTLKVFKQALRQSVPEIHHSDQGVQYLSEAYLSTLTQQGIEISVSQRGCPWENRYAERLIRILKEEEVHLNDSEDIPDVRVRIGHFIEQVYHHKRPHSALRYLTPIEFQRRTLS